MNAPSGGPALPAEAPRTLVLGSRTSRLATIQAERVAGRFRRRWPGLEVEVRGMTTRGDRALDRSLPEIGGKGVFTAELEDALVEGTADLAVHSLKDLPTDLPEGLALLGVPEREDPRDVLVWPGGGGGLEELPEGAVVGTSSLRRRAQLLARRSDCRVEEIRGNVDTRVEKCSGGDYDAVILAAAGLLRLEMESVVTRWLSAETWLPAAGQGALALEGRAGDRGVRSLVDGITRPELEAETGAERSLLAALEVGCRIPLGARARVRNGELSLEAGVFSPDGTEAIRVGESAPIDRAGELGRRVADRLREEGAERILGPLREGGP